MPPPGFGSLSPEEKLTFVRWIDLGAPLDQGPYGWFLDDLKPTLELSLPRPGYNGSTVDTVRLGVADANSGIDPSSLSVTADFAVQGRSAGAELADLAVQVGDGIYEISLQPALGSVAEAHVYSEVRDLQGNATRVDRRFTTVPGGTGGLVFRDGFEIGFGVWSTATD